MNVKRAILLAVIFLAIAGAAQARPRLAILPFTGGGGTDGETIAMLLGHEPALRNAFTPVSRTAAVEAIMREHWFQRAGLTDEDTIRELGRQMNADYIVAGHIQQLGRSRLVHITIIHVESLQQIAGDFREYNDISEIRAELPGMARRIVEASGRGGGRQPSLAVLPFHVMSGQVNDVYAEILAQLLATEIANSGRYAVLPRTSAIERTMAEHAIQRGGITDPTNIRRLGAAANADFVLAGVVSTLGVMNLFMVDILDVESGEIMTGGSEEYREVSDGLVRMQALAQTLTAGAVRAAPGRAAGNFVRVQGGTFQMGRCPTGQNVTPMRNVTVSSFYMSRHQVTQREWVELMGSNPSHFRGDNRPVEMVSWFEAVEFANRKSQRAGLTPAYTISGTNVTWNRGVNGYRLPTEAEWEFAARGGIVCQGNFTFSGGNTLGDLGWYTGNSGGSTQDVGMRRPNALGIYDMSGNVSEWVWDWHGPYLSAAQTDPVGASSGSNRVIRGGSWGSSGFVCSVIRGGGVPAVRLHNLGFRLVRP